MQISYKEVDPAFALGAVVDTLHDFIASSLLFSLSVKEKVVLTGCEQAFGDVQTSSPIFPELSVWLTSDGEQYCTQPPLTLKSSGLSKAVS